MFDDPDFAYNVLRPIAVVGGWLLAMKLGAMLGGWLDSRRARGAASLRNVTPGRVK